MSIQKYIVVYEYEARYDTELDLYKDEVIMLSGSEDGGWSEGKNDKGKQGWFPTTFIAPFSSNPNSLSTPGVASSPTPITRHDSRSSVSVLKGTKDDSLTDKKKKRSLFTKSMKLSSEDLKRKPEMRKEPSVSSSLSSSHSSPPTPPQKNNFTTTSPSISPSHSPSSPPVIAPSSPSPLSNSGALHSFSSSPLASSGDHTNETDSIVDNMKKTSGYLSKWLNSRVTKEKMKEKGLIDEVEVKQETIFGEPLDNILAEHGAPIPSFVLQAVNYITKNAIKEQGIFRVSGVASVVCSLGHSFAKSGAQVSFDDMDCHVVSGFLKKFFRDLPEPLFTFENNDAFISAVGIENQQERANKFRSIFNSLPKKNQDLIVYLLKFLHQVSTNSEANLMHSNNLGVVFGPTLMRSKQDTLGSFMNPSNNSVSVIAACISDFELIFGQGNAQPEQRPEQRPDRPASHSPVPPQKPRPVPGVPQQAHPIQQAQPVQAAQNAPTPPTKPRSDAKAAPPAAKPIFKPPQRPLSTSKPPLPERKEEPKAELARALYDYNGDPAMSQLSFKAGDAIQIVLKHPSGWWTGIVNGRQGLFPMNFIQSQ